MSTMVPSQPLVVILGSTGTGKSELAVELATRFKGEIINTDAMQMYRGLPILTNKIAPEEQRSIPHHLLGHIPLDQETWVVGDFKREADKVIKEIRSRDRLPIVVGGTHYYINALLFDTLLEADNGQGEFPELDEPTEVLFKKLSEVDPAMAERWHPNDRRKIRRSLEIYLRTGKRASEFYAEQAAAEPDHRADRPWEALLFWVYSDPDVLKKRLDSRFDKMLSAGLVEEVQELYRYLDEQRDAGREVDLTRGIWQSIGFKEFQKYLEFTSGATPDAEASPDAAEAKALKDVALEEVKSATRQYAKYQTRWIKSKTIPLLRREHGSAMDHLFVVDSTDISKWSEKVVQPAESITRQFLAGESLPSPVGLSETARNVLEVARQPAENTLCRRVCDVCQVTVLYEHKWREHLRSHKHRRILNKKKRLALVPIADDSDGSEQKRDTVCDSNSRSSSLDLDLDLGIMDSPSP